MAVSFLQHAVRHPSQIKSIIAVLLYRKEREKSRCDGRDSASICEKVGGELGISLETVREAVHYWIHQYTIKFLPSYSYKDFIGWINRKRADGVKIYIYSDYPAIEKCRVLGNDYDAVFISDEIGYLKPDKRAMEYVIRHISSDKDGIAYIRDRDEIDGLAAESVGIRYYNMRSIRNRGRIKEV